MSSIKTKVGAGATLAALGGLAAYAVGSGEQQTTDPAASTQPVEVRTQTIRRTIHVVKREKPRRSTRRSQGGTAAPAPGPPSVPAQSTAAAAPPAPTRVVSAPAPTPPVTTRSSGSGSGRSGDDDDREHEHENEAEHEGDDD